MSLPSASSGGRRRRRAGHQVENEELVSVLCGAPKYRSDRCLRLLARLVARRELIVRLRSELRFDVIRIGSGQPLKIRKSPRSLEPRRLRQPRMPDDVMFGESGRNRSTRVGEPMSQGQRALLATFGCRRRLPGVGDRSVYERRDSQNLFTTCRPRHPASIPASDC